MGTLAEDIETASDWLVKAFREDHIHLDFSIKSLIEIDKFFNLHAVNGQAVKGGRLSKNLGSVLFAIASYVGDSLIKAVPGSKWITDDNDPEGEINISVLFPNGSIVWPMQRIMKRFKIGSEESAYVYVYQLTKEFTKEEFDNRYWELKEKPEKWWKFW